MKQLCLLTFILFLSIYSFSQQKKPTLAAKRIEQIRLYLSDSKLNVPHYIFDSIIENYQKALTGTTIKEGKYAASSLTVDDKGASVQFVFKPLKAGRGAIYPGLNAAGSGDKSFVSIIKDGKYSQTLSGGFNLNYFPATGRAKFLRSNKWETKALVDKLQNDFDSRTGPFNYNAQKLYLEQAVNSLKAYELLADTASKYVEKIQTQKGLTGEKNPFLGKADLITAARIARDTVISIGLLKTDYAGKVPTARKKELDLIKVEEDYLLEKNYLVQAEKTLMEAKWTSVSLQWWTFKANINVSPQPLIDTLKPGEDFLRTYNDKYFTFTIGFNSSKKWNRSLFQIGFSPAINFSTARDFAKLTKIKITKIQPFVYNASPLEQVMFTSEGYNELPASKLGWSAELPLVLYWGKVNWGIDLAIRGGQNNPKNDNFGGRLGIYIPIEVKDGTPIWIEPIVRVGKLFQEKSTKTSAGDKSFWKDNVEVGFNLAIALPQVKALK